MVRTGFLSILFSKEGMIIGMEEWYFPGFHIVTAKEQCVFGAKYPLSKELEYTIKLNDEEVECPECHAKCEINANYVLEKVQDVPLNGNRVYLNIMLKRYRCKHCNKNIKHPALISLVRGQSKLTNRLIQEIKRYSLTFDTEYLSEDYLLPKTTILKLTAEYISDREKDWKYYTPSCLGLFSLKVAGQWRMLCFDLDLDDYAIIDFLDNANEESIGAYLTDRIEKDKVKTTVIALNRTHREMVRKYLPESTVIIDLSALKQEIDNATEKELLKFEALSNFESIKKAVLAQKKESRNKIIEEACKKSETFSYFYTSKENLYKYYQSVIAVKDKKKDVSEIDDWFGREEARYYPLYTYFSKCANKLIDFSEEIKNTTQNNYVRDYAQQTMNLASTLQKCGKGYKFENLRARVLFAPKTRIKTAGNSMSIKYMPSGAYDMMKMSMDYYAIPKTEIIVGNYVSIKDVHIEQLLAEEIMKEGDYPTNIQELQRIEEKIAEQLKTMYDL